MAPDFYSLHNFVSLRVVHRGAAPDIWLTRLGWLHRTFNAALAQICGGCAWRVCRDQTAIHTLEMETNRKERGLRR